MLTTTILSMSLAPAGAYAQEVAANAQATPNASFTDISKVSPDRLQAVQDAVAKGLLNGFPNGQFQPDKQLTRQELAVILARALNLMPSATASTTTSSTFTDTASLWSAPYIEAVRQAGLMGGSSDGHFRPTDILTREELATVFVRSVGGANAQGGEASGTGTAKGASKWAADMVEKSNQLGLMEDEQGTTPKSPVNREDVAAYLVEIFNAKEQTAVIEKIDGDYVTIDGETVLVTKELKALFAGQNLDALKGAKLTYSQQNKNIEGLAKLEIAASGTDAKSVTFDATGSNFDGDIVIAGDKVAIKGEKLTQVTLGEKASRIELNAKVDELAVSAGQSVTISGAAAIEKIKVGSDKTKITLGKDVAIEKVELPTGVKMSDVIANYDAVKVQIKIREADPAPVYSGGGSVNQAPVLTGTSLGLTDGLVGTPITKEVSAAFNDEDKTSLIYSPQSSNTAVATVSVTGSTLTITPLAVGTTTITVKATDAQGQHVNYTFEFAVAVPVLSGTPIVIDQGYLGDPAVTTDVSVAFNDEIYTSLTYSVSSSALSVATAEITADKTLTVTPIAAGTTTITVTAKDETGKLTDYSFTYTVMPALTIERKDETPFYINGTNTSIALNTTNVTPFGYTYGKRTLKDYVKIMYKGKEVSSLEYDITENDFNVKDEQAMEIAELKLSSNSDKIAFTSNAPAGMLITPNALEENLDADMIFSLQTTDSAPQVIEVPITVDKTAPVSVVEPSDDFKTFTFTVNEKLTVHPIVGMQIIPNIIVNDNALQLNLTNDYTANYDSMTNKITLILTSGGFDKIKNTDGIIPNDTKFSFTIMMTDFSDNLVAPVTYTVSRTPN
ncbi:S-layer family protein [Paenibacillus methanolicus]|uniref:S-layer family protein n=2 Tax=Paenibacillus methanolicus TaxID=582686 RepID=A0A5S5C7Q8_9BACL|nr:S-layer family protein [Paenibacillus methanolicus]